MLCAEYISQMAEALDKLRSQSPLVYILTNQVVSNSTANGLLALGAVPAMIVAEEEVEEFVPLSQAVNINIGTLTPYQAKVMTKAVRCASRHAIPWVLDPVAVGLLSYRTDFALSLLEYKPSIIRGNAGEILSLHKKVVHKKNCPPLFDGPLQKGVDSLVSSSAALEAAKELAYICETVVCVSGPHDYVTDGQQVYVIQNGHPMMPLVTGLGCLASAISTACAVISSPLEAATNAMAFMGISGQLAGQAAKGPGSLQTELINQLYFLSSETLITHLRCEKFS